MKTSTAGTTTAQALRRYFSVSPRSARFRRGEDLFARMLESVEIASCQPGYYSETTESALRPAYAVVLGYRKHVQGSRISGETIYRISTMTPWQFAGFLGEMVDAGITNVGEAERFYRGMAA